MRPRSRWLTCCGAQLRATVSSMFDSNNMRQACPCTARKSGERSRLAKGQTKAVVIESFAITRLLSAVETVCNWPRGEPLQTGESILCSYLIQTIRQRREALLSGAECRSSSQNGTGFAHRATKLHSRCLRLRLQCDKRCKNGNSGAKIAGFVRREAKAPDACGN
jgi:hypothetical protein